MSRRSVISPGEMVKMRRTIGVIGSSGGELAGVILQRAYRLGEAIATAGAVLVTGGCPGLPYEASAGREPVAGS